MHRDESGNSSVTQNEELRDKNLPLAADSIRKEMEILGEKIREIVLSQPPIQLLGYVLSQFHLAITLTCDDLERKNPPNKEAIKTFQFALEYIHAIWCSHNPLIEDTPLEEKRVVEALNLLEEIQEKTMLYCMFSSKSDTEFHAKTTWVLIRGHRYQALEEEFFRFVLEPHDDALRQAYGIGSNEIASGIQNISNAFRSGFSGAADKLLEHMDETYKKVDETGDSIENVINQFKNEDTLFKDDMSGIFHDMFFGGTCNLSRHSKLPQVLLEDLSYEPGQNIDFFKQGDFSGTPMRTLPARIKPGIKLGDDFYTLDGQFVRDAAYRAIQWGLWKRLPYRDEWLKRQASLIERAYPAIFVNQLSGAQIFESVFYKDIHTDEWVETDLIIILADVLFVIEAKAGVMPMHSPATNFNSHERVIQDLIIKAYLQSKRFLEYLASAREVPLYKIINGEYVEIKNIRMDFYRLIFPIGLTVEAFTPFSAMAKELQGVEPILGKHPFISMSVDDLFVLNRFLPTTGELIHYLEVRQQVAGIKRALIFDEIDHLGAYITKNRFDLDIHDQLITADMISLDGFSNTVDQYFEEDSWQMTSPPSQFFPKELIFLLKGLNDIRPTNWLRFDSMLRNYGHETRENISNFFNQTLPTLKIYPRRRFQIGEDEPLQIWLCHNNEIPSSQEIKYQAQVGCLTVNALKMQIIVIGFTKTMQISGLLCTEHQAPSIKQDNYSIILNESERQRSRIIKLN